MSWQRIDTRYAIAAYTRVQSSGPLSRRLVGHTEAGASPPRLLCVGESALIHHAKSKPIVVSLRQMLNVNSSELSPTIAKIVLYYLHIVLVLYTAKLLQNCI